jgi:hypothetical protein
MSPLAHPISLKYAAYFDRKSKANTWPVKCKLLSRRSIHPSITQSVASTLLRTPCQTVTDVCATNSIVKFNCKSVTLTGRKRRRNSFFRSKLLVAWGISSPRHSPSLATQLAPMPLINLSNAAVNQRLSDERRMQTRAKNNSFSSSLSRVYVDRCNRPELNRAVESRD